MAARGEAVSQHYPAVSASGRWVGYAAASTAWAFAVVSIYWGLGGTAGLGTLGGEIEARAKARDPLLMGLNWVAVALKLAGGCFALMLVRRWGLSPGRLLVMLGWTASLVLILYGGTQTLVVLLVLVGVLDPVTTVDPVVLRWRLLLWEPWFLLWGVLLVGTVRGARRSARAASPRP